MSVSETTEESVVIHLGTPIAEANASAVASTMQAMIAIVDEAQKELQANNALLLKARPFSTGSFEIPFELILVGLPFVFDKIGLIEEVLRILKEYIEVRKLLQGEPLPPAKGGTVVLNGNVTVSNSVVNIVHNSVTTAAFDKAATEIEADPTIQNLKVLRGKDREPIASISRDDIKSFRADVSPPTIPKKRERIETKLLVIKSPDFGGRAKWEFVLDGHTISADILDENFIHRVLERAEVFAAGDRLEVELIVRSELVPSLATYKPKSYSVLRVLRHLDRPDEEPLPLF